MKKSTNNAKRKVTDWQKFVNYCSRHGLVVTKDVTRGWWKLSRVNK